MQDVDSQSLVECVSDHLSLCRITIALVVLLCLFGVSFRLFLVQKYLTLSSLGELLDDLEAVLVLNEFVVQERVGSISLVVAAVLLVDLVA